MADIEYSITKITGKKAEGTLKWPAKSLASSAISGPYGNGYLPAGSYLAFRNKMLDKPSGSSYCDTKNKCWMQPLDPQFSTTRTDLGIHPDGGPAGTEGCIGIEDPDTKKWYDAFYGVSGSSSVEVRIEAHAFRSYSDSLFVDCHPIIAVVGSGASEHADLAEPLGRLIAELGCSLLTGGGMGVMTAVARAFCMTPARTGTSIGVLPAGKQNAYPNPWIEIPIQTHLPGDNPEGSDSRNHINILSAAAVVVLPGGKGSRAEASLASRYERPVCVFCDDDARFVVPYPEGLHCVRSLEEVKVFLRENVLH
jgi:uncharacterized protein (TIGR00725 family)